MSCQLLHFKHLIFKHANQETMMNYAWRTYDRSWSEWGASDELPKEIPSKG